MEQYKKETEVTEMDGFVEIAMLTVVRKKEEESRTQPAPDPAQPEQ